MSHPSGRAGGGGRRAAQKDGFATASKGQGAPRFQRTGIPFISLTEIRVGTAAVGFHLAPDSMVPVSRIIAGYGKFDGRPQQTFPAVQFGDGRIDGSFAGTVLQAEVARHGDGRQNAED